MPVLCPLLNCPARRRAHRVACMRRRVAGFALAAAVLPLLTVVLAAGRAHLNLADFV